MKSPKYKTCSVLMSVYKNDRPEWFERAVESVLSQTLKSDDIVIIRDGAVGDEIEEILKRYEKRKNIRIVRLKKNGGLAHALNVGLKKCKNELVARMDSDDIMAKRRLRLQINEFNERLDLDLLGGQITEFDGLPENVVGRRRVPLLQGEIKKFAKLRSPFNHVSVMFKKKKILGLGGYNENIGKIEDYELWQRVLHSDFSVANMREDLCLVRADKDMIERRRDLMNFKNQIRCRWQFLRSRWISVGDFLISFCLCSGIFILPKSLVKLAYRSR